MKFTATPITYFGEELGSSDATPFNWDNAEYGVAGQQKANESHYKVYEALVKARDTQTVLYGNSNIKVSFPYLSFNNSYCFILVI